MDMETAPRRRRRRVAAWTTMAVVVVVAAAVWLLHPRPLRVAVQTVRAETIQDKTFASGDVKPLQRQVVEPTQLTSPLVSVAVTVGEHVQAGALLGRMNDTAQAAALSAAETALTEAQAALKATEQQADAAPPAYRAQFTGTLAQERTSVAQAQAQLAQAQAAEDATRITATLTGTVVLVNPDGIAPDGTEAPVFEVVGSAKQVVLDVSQVDAVHLHTGLAAQLTSDAYPNHRWRGEVTFVAPFASASGSGSNQVEVHVSMPKDCPIPIGYQVNVNIVSQTHKGALVVPYDALVQSGSQYGVFVLTQDHRVRWTSVQLGITTDTAVEVTSGLRAGDAVVVNPPSNLHAGDKVVVTSHG